MTLDGLGELGLLERIKPYLAVQSGRDDAAVIADTTGFVIASCDMFVEGVHFDFAWMSPEDVGRRALALALGDLAAKGAAPLWALSAVAMPKAWKLERLTGIYSGMSELAQTVKLSIVGGDMSATNGPGILSLTVVGHTVVMPLARAQAEAGWVVAVTGALGASAVALRERRPLRLTPLLDDGRRLNEAGLCCGDISDGLVREMEKFAAMAGVGCVIDTEDVPRAPGASLEDALTSGEETELVCVGPDALIKDAGLHAVGRLTEEPGVRVVDAGGSPVPLARTGYDHFG